MKNKLFLISFLNKLGYNLQCYERPLTIVLEKMGINYMYYMLFFKEYDTMIWGSNLQQYVSQKLGVDFITKFKSVQEFETISKSQNLILYSDHFYNSQYYKYYNKKHYRHPFLLEYCKNNSCFIIDENLTALKYNNKYYNWVYEENEINIQQLKNICCNWSEENKSDKGFYYTQVKIRDKKIDICSDDIIKDYKELIEFLIDNILAIKEYFSESIFRFLSFSNYDYRSQLINKLYNHNKAVNRQYRLVVNMLDMLGGINNLKNEQEFDILRNKLLILYNNMVKIHMANITIENKNIIEIYEDIWKLELKLYIFFIQLINKGTLKKCIDIIQYKIH